MSKKSQVICFQISLWVGSVINITCLHYCSLMSSSSLLENCDNIYLIPISWELSYSYFLSADFQSPQMSLIWAWSFGLLLLPHLYCNLIPFILRILVRRVFFLDKDVKSNLGAGCSLFHLRTSFFLLWEEGLLFLDLLAAKTAANCHLLFSYSPCFFRMCYPWGSQYVSHFHIRFWRWALTQDCHWNSELLSRIAVSFFNLSCLLCQMVASFSACSSTLTLTPKIFFEGCNTQLRGFPVY